jgi:DnaJ-domain-containing protein 1
METVQDYYSVLGIDSHVTEEEIKKAFRGLARQYHPDVNSSPDAEAKFKQINEAYSVLGDPERRQQYDLGLNAARTTERTQTHPEPNTKDPFGNTRDEFASHDFQKAEQDLRESNTPVTWELLIGELLKVGLYRLVGLLHQKITTRSKEGKSVEIDEVMRDLHAGMDRFQKDIGDATTRWGEGIGSLGESFSDTIGSWSLEPKDPRKER